MAQKRSEFYKSLNQMRDSNQTLGNPLINNVDDTTDVGSELSSFAYQPISADTGIDWVTDTQINQANSEREYNEYKASRNGWQRFWDTFQDIGNNIAEGVLNFVDGIFDAGAYVVGLFGDDEFKQGVQNVMNYDWQQHVLNVGQQLNIGNAILTGDMFSGEYWQNWADTFTLTGSRDNLNKTKASSFQSDWGGFGEFLQSAEEGIGYVLPSIIVGIATGGASVGVQAAAAGIMVGATGISAFGSGTNEALNNGATYEQAGQSGLITGAIEMGTEALSWGVGKIAGKIAGKATTYGTRVGATSFGQQLGKLSAKEIGKAALEEGTEEFISELLSPLAKQVYQEDAIKNAWFNVGSDENREMWRNAFISGGAGAIGGAFGATVQGVNIKHRLSNQGIDLANQYSEIVNLHEEALKEAQKGQGANQELISQYENRIGELTKQFESGMESFKETNPEKFKNLMEMIKNPKAYLEQIKKENSDLTKEQLLDYKNSYLEDFKSITQSLNQDTYNKIAELNSNNNGDIKIGKVEDFDSKNFTDEFLKENGIKEGETIKAYYDPDSKITLINPAYKTEFYELMAHENISHGILDTNDKVKSQLIEAIEKNDGLNELFHKNDTKLEELYGSQGQDVLTSERLASFLENFVKNQKSYNQVLKIKQGNKLLNVLNKIKSYFSMSQDSKFLRQLEKAIDNVKQSVEPNSSTYKPRLAFSKTYNEEGKATGVDVHADIIKDAAQSFQDRFTNLKTVEDVYKIMVDSMESMVGKDITMKKSRFKFARETFVDFNSLLNKPEELRTRLTESVDEFLKSEVSFDSEYLLEDKNGETIPVNGKVKLTLEEVLERSGENLEQFKKDSVVALEKILKETSQKSRLLKIKEFYRNHIQSLSEKVAYYKQVAGDVIKLKSFWDKGRNFVDDNKARATKVGDTYVAKLDFYKNIFKGKFSYSQTYKNVSPGTITNIVNGLDGYTKENIEKIGGIWTTIEEVGVRGISNETIRESADFLKSKFQMDKKDGKLKFPNRALTLDELESVRTILQGINTEMKELVSKEGIARQQRLYKADLELKVIDSSKFKDKFGKAGISRIIENELNYNSSMDTVFANLFGADSDIHHIMYDDIFTALDNKYLQESRMRNELQSLLEKYDMWSKKTSSPKSLFTKLYDFAGRKVPKGILMDIYAETLTSKGLATLQKGGYVYKLDNKTMKEHLVLNSDLILQLDELLTNEEKSFVEELVAKEYNESWKKYKSDKDIQIRSFSDVLEEEVYYPTNKADMSSKGTDSVNFQSLDLSDQSFNKRRNDNTAHLALKGMDIIDRARAYIDGLTKYGEMTQQLKLFDSLLKQWTTDTNGVAMSRDNLFAKNIPGWTKNGKLQGYKDYLIGQILGTNTGVLQGKTFGNLVAATLYGNVSVVLKQTASLPTIMLEVSPKAWAKSLTKGWKNLAQYKTTRQFIENQSGIAAQRWADFDSVAANTLQKEVNKIGKFFGIPMEKMDEGVIVLFGWQAAQEEAKIRTKAEIGTPENQREAIKILNKIIANTQSNAISLNMSMSRSGNAGYIRKVLSYFSSDLQNKVSRLNRILNETKYAKQRLEGISIAETKAQQELDIAKTNLEKFKVESKDVENFSEEVERLENIVQSKQDVLDIVHELKTSETNILSGGRRATEALKYAISVLLSAAMVSGIEELVKRLYGRKGWDEDTLDEFGRNLLIESTIGNLPYASNIINSIEYDQDIGGYDFTLINSAIDIIKDVKSMIEKGEFNPSVLVDLFTTVGQLSGIPIKNLYNLVMGVWKNVDGSGYSAEALLKGYSDTYIRKAYKEQLDKGQMKQANAYLELLMSSYKVGNNDSEVNSEINRLMKVGYNAIPKNFMTSYEDEEQNEVKLSSEQQNEFVLYYGKATEDVKKILNSESYKSLDDEYKAKVIKKIYDSYYDYAKNKVLKTSSTNKVVNVLIHTNGGIKLNKYVGVLANLSNIEATKKKTRKELVLEQINKLKGYTKQEKLLIAWLCGYSLTKENKVSLGNYLIKSGGNKKAIKELLK